MQTIKRFLNTFLNPLVPVLLLLIAAFTFVDAYPAADLINYHLPFAIRQFALHGYPDYQGFQDHLFYGFPSLWRVLLAPGLAFDFPRLFLLPNLIGLGLFAFICRHFLKLSLAQAAACCLVFPVAFFGFRSALQDFFVNSMTASAMLLLLYPRKLSNQSCREFFLLPRELFGMSLLAISANIKFQGFFMAFILLLSWIFLRWREKPKRLSTHSFLLGRAMNLRLFVACVLCAVIAFQPIYNIARFGNPFTQLSWQV